MRKTVLILLVFVMMISLGTGCKKEVDLTPANKIGQALKYGFSVVTTSQLNLFGRAITVTNKVGVEFTQKDTETGPSGLRRVELTYNRITMDADLQMFKIHLDTAEKESTHPMLQPIAEHYVGKTAVLEIQKNGEVTIVKGFDPAPFKGQPGDPMNNPLVAKEIGAVFEKNLLTSLVEATTFFGPGKPVDVGHAWQANGSFNGTGYIVSYKENLVFTELKDSVAVIKGTGTLADDAGSAQVLGSMMGMAGFKVSSFSAKNTYRFDTKKNHLLKMDSNVDVELSGSLPNQQDITFPSKVYMELTLLK